MPINIPKINYGDIKVDSIVITKDDSNVKLGYQTLAALTSGTENVALGYQVLNANTSGTANVGIGRRAMYYTQGGSYNVAIGRNTLLYCVSGNNNVAVGYNSLNGCTASNNVAVGRNTGNVITTGSDSVYIGYGAGDHATQKVDAANCICIGTNVISTESNKVVIGNSSITKVGFGGGEQMAYEANPTDLPEVLVTVTNILAWMQANKLQAAS
jgi:hypothetical protein